MPENREKVINMTTPEGAGFQERGKINPRLFVFVNSRGLKIFYGFYDSGRNV